MAVFVKRLAPQLPHFELVFFRSIINFLFVFFWFVRSDGLRSKSTVSPKTRKILIFRGLTGFGGVTCHFFAISHLPIAVAMLLGWSSPLFVLILSRLILKEKLGARAIALMGVAFFGVIFLVRPNSGGLTQGLPLLGVLAGLVGALFSGSAYVAVRAATAKVQGRMIVLYFTGIATLLSIPLAALNFQAPTLAQSIELLFMGGFATLGQVTMTEAYRHAPAGLVSALSLLSAVFSAILGWVVFGERLVWMQWIGMLLLASSIILLAAGHRLARKNG